MRRRLEEHSRQYIRDTAPTQAPEPLEANYTLSTQRAKTTDTQDTVPLVSSSQETIEASGGSTPASLNVLAITPDEILEGLTRITQSQPIDIEDDGKASALASLSTFLPHGQMETDHHLLRPVTSTEHRAVEALLANPVKYGMEDLLPHLLKGAWYTGDIVSCMAVKLTRWLVTTTDFNRWVFLGADIINGITAGYSMPWARNKLTQAISEDTQYTIVCMNNFRGS